MSVFLEVVKTFFSNVLFLLAVSIAPVSGRYLAILSIRCQPGYSQTDRLLKLKSDTTMSRVLTSPTGFENVHEPNARAGCSVATVTVNLLLIRGSSTFNQHKMHVEAQGDP